MDYFNVFVGYLLGYSDDKKDLMLISFELVWKDDIGEYFDL